MDNEKIARQLVKIAGELVAADGFEEHDDAKPLIEEISKFIIARAKKAGFSYTQKPNRYVDKNRTSVRVKVGILDFPGNLDDTKDKAVKKIVDTVNKKWGKHFKKFAETDSDNSGEWVKFSIAINKLK